MAYGTHSPLRGLVVVALWVAVAACEYALVGGGASSQSLLWNIFGFVYRDVDPTSQIYYTPTSSGQGVSDIENKSLDFAGSDVMQTDATLDQQSLYQFPIAAMAIALLYNVAGASNLVLDRQTVVDIFSGKIVYWNDPAIAQLNPSYALPNASILIIYRQGGSGTNQVFTEALQTFDPSFNFSNDPATWPFAKQGRGMQALESGDIAVFVDNFPNSIGYVAHPFANGLPTVSMINKSGKETSPTLATVQAALQGGYPIQATYLDSANPGAYPMVTPTFILFPRDTHQDCQYTLSLAEMLYWTTSSDLAIQAATYQDYMQVPNDLLTPYTELLTLIKCNGKYAYDYLYEYEIILLVVGCLMSAACLVFVSIVFITRTAYHINKINPWGLMVTIVGHAATYASVYLWIGYPSDWVCKSRPFIIFLTFISVVVQLNETIRVTFNMKKFRHRFGGEYLEHKISVGLFAINLVIVATWLGVDPPTEIHRRCMGTQQNAFLIALVGYNVALVGGVFLCNVYAMHVNKTTSNTDDSQKTILIAIFAACVYLPINFLHYRSNYNFLGQLLAPATGTIIYSTLQICVVILPQLRISFRALRTMLMRNTRIHVISFSKPPELELSKSADFLSASRSTDLLAPSMSTDSCGP